LTERPFDEISAPKHLRKAKKRLRRAQKALSAARKDRPEDALKRAVLA